MNKVNTIVYPAVVALSLLSAFAVHAENPSIDDSATQQWAVTMSRAEVRQEMLAARGRGDMTEAHEQQGPVFAAAPAKTRAQVRAEAITAHFGDYAATWYGEDSGSFALGQVRPTREAAPRYAGAAQRIR